MAVDPSISLDVAGGGGNTPAPQPPNVLGAYSTIMQLQNQQIQLTQAKAQLAARQKLGSIIAAAPDFDTGLAQAAADPGVAGFGGEPLAQLQAMRSTMVGVQGQQQNQAQTALGAVIKGSASAVRDPSQLGALIQSQLAGLPPEVQARAKPMVGSWVHSLTDGLPSDPQAASLEMQKRILSGVAGAGVSSDAFSNILGTPTTRQTGNTVVSGVQGTALDNGAFSGGNALGIGQPAGYHDVNGQVVALPGVAAGGNALGGGSAVGVPQGRGGPPQGAQMAPGNTTQGNGAPSVGWTGQPFQIGRVAFSGRDALGNGVLNPPDQQNDQELQKTYATEGRTQFDAANNTLGNLETLDKSYDKLALGGGKFLTPGALSDARLGLARLANTMAQVTGVNVPFDASSVASAEDFNKVAGQLVQQATKQAYGQSHVAADTIHGVTQTVPQLSNSYLGGKLLVGGLQATSQRILDQRAFEQQWKAQNNGRLIGADESFNRQFPASSYADKVLSAYGMDATGHFNSLEDVVPLVAKGLLTKEQAIAIAKSQKLMPATPTQPSGGTQ